VYVYVCACLCPFVNSVVAPRFRVHPDDLVRSHKRDRHQSDRFDPFDIGIDNARASVRSRALACPRRAPSTQAAPGHRVEFAFSFSSLFVL